MTNKHDTTQPLEELHIFRPVSNDPTTDNLEPVALRDLTDVTRDLCASLAERIDRTLLSGDARRVFQVAERIAGHYGQEPKGEREAHLRIADLLYLDALIVSPEALLEALTRLRTDLVAADPALAIIAAPTEVRDA